MVDAFFFLAPHIFLSYSLMYLVIPKFIFRGKYVSAVIIVLVLFFITACISATIGVYVLPNVREKLFTPNQLLPHYATPGFFLSLLAGLRGGITIAGLAASIKLMKYWYLKEQRNLQLQKENVEAQLQLLKAQVQPHFLFNTLNSIYSHTLITSPVAAKLVTGLSDMLRFILYECNQPLIPLSKEIRMIKDYIHLEQARYGNKLDLHVDLPEETNEFAISPLLLLPLVENSFKHGASNMLEHPWISLQITMQENEMTMKLINGKPVPQTGQAPNQGIGLLNVEKRLALLYPEKHELTITNDTDVFIINLKIELEPLKSISSRPAMELQPAYA
jgi:hypothetical protein